MVKFDKDGFLSVGGLDPGLTGAIDVSKECNLIEPSPDDAEYISPWESILTTCTVKDLRPGFVVVKVCATTFENLDPDVDSIMYPVTETPHHDMEKLNEELEFKDDKSCKFTCALSLCWPDGYNITVQGEICGEFSWPPSGRNGFGYDPIFYYPKLKKTFGELDPAIKHEISHRNLAFKKLKTEIKKIVHE